MHFIVYVLTSTYLHFQCGTKKEWEASLSVEFQDINSSIAKNLMSDFTNGEEFQSSQSKHEPLPLTLAKWLLDEFEDNANANKSTTKMKLVKMENEWKLAFFLFNFVIWILFVLFKPVATLCF